jgi:3-methyl-2-oxobutanoate hydroxymethyltransferase
MKKTLEFLSAKKRDRRPITMVTAYDFPTARLEDEAGVDAILVGDSVGTNVLGLASEREVTMADMLHHAAAVARGVKSACLLADLPYRSAETPLEAEENARRLLDRGIECVKIEGWGEAAGTVTRLAAKEAGALIEAARRLEEAGAALLIMEKLPREVAGIITGLLRIPAIGIGSGPCCDGQVLVVNDLLGMTGRNFSHARRYADLRTIVLNAVRAYADEVERGTFPGDEHCRRLDPEVLNALNEMRG